MELGAAYPPRRRASVDTPDDLPVMQARWAARQEVESLHGRQYPRELWLDTEPLWEGRWPRARGGAKARQQKERDDKRRQEEEAAHSSSFSSRSQTSVKATQEKRLNSLLGGILPVRPYFRVSPSAALTYEDTQVGHGEEEGLQCWSLARVMNAYKRMGKTMVDYATLPPM